MAEFPSLPLWTDALIGDTHHLTPAEFGAYLRLLIAAWRSPGCKLNYSDAQLGRIIGDPKNWHRLKSVVMSFWVLGEDGCYRQKRLTDEHDFVSRQKAKSSAGGKAKALKGRHMRSAKGLPNGCLNDAPTPTPTPTKNLVQNFENDFLDFYSAYPKKQSKRTAEKAYESLRKRGVTHSEIMDGLSNAKRSDQRFRELKFTPMPASWLNAGGYADETADRDDWKKAVLS